MFPDWAKELIIAKGVNAALDWTAEVTAPFTSQSYFDEVQGMADASGLSYDTIYRINMYPELTKASCSFFGAWGTAVGYVAAAAAAADVAAITPARGFSY